MKREEAVSLIKEITEEKCTNIVGHDIILVLSEQDDPLSEGYKLQIKKTLNLSSARCLDILVKQNGFVLRNDKGYIEIFTPKALPLYKDMGRM